MKKIFEISIDNLLRKVSLEICEIVKAHHRSNVEKIGSSIENTRDDLKKILSEGDLFELDSKIFEITEKKKKSLVENHRKKAEISPARCGTLHENSRQTAVVQIII